jgi:hypothetical protein
MKIVAHYRNEQLQHKGWHALEKFRPSKSIEDGYPTLSIEVTMLSDVMANDIIQQLKKTSMPFLIEKVKEPVHDGVE